jgi:hypothetical protein
MGATLKNTNENSNGDDCNVNWDLTTMRMEKIEMK